MNFFKFIKNGSNDDESEYEYGAIYDCDTNQAPKPTPKQAPIFSFPIYSRNDNCYVKIDILINNSTSTSIVKQVFFE
jgi:hypothetical protein